ncbi:MAG TPA: cupin domain-containing protein [Verrucomicrobiae bacterium]|nr:cupin domain-containing protein [Verrucomicrobiae bacterium]
MRILVSIVLLAVVVGTARAQNADKSPVSAADQAAASTNAQLAAGAATYIDSAKVTALFEKGGTMVQTPGYKVMASRRETPGRVEIHTYETDVFYIIDGTATFVTGGTCADAKVVGPGQLLGTTITGGVEHHLKKGDVIVVPAGLPHQYTEVSHPFLYLTVKPIKAQ